jgi:hypothetical protein
MGVNGEHGETTKDGYRKSIYTWRGRVKGGKVCDGLKWSIGGEDYHVVEWRLRFHPKNKNPTVPILDCNVDRFSRQWIEIKTNRSRRSRRG